MKLSDVKPALGFENIIDLVHPGFFVPSRIFRSEFEKFINGDSGTPEVDNKNKEDK